MWCFSCISHQTGSFHCSSLLYPFHLFCRNRPITPFPASPSGLLEHQWLRTTDLEEQLNKLWPLLMNQQTIQHVIQCSGAPWWIDYWWWTNRMWPSHQTTKLHNLLNCNHRWWSSTLVQYHSLIFLFTLLHRQASTRSKTPKLLQEHG